MFLHIIGDRQTITKFVTGLHCDLSRRYNNTAVSFTLRDTHFPWHTSYLIFFWRPFARWLIPEILSKIKLYGWIKAFVRRYIHSLKQYEWNQFKFKYLWWTICTVESEWGVPCPDVCWVSATRPSGGKTAAASSWAGWLSGLQPREGLNRDFIHLFTFCNISNAGIFMTIFT